MIIIDSKGEKVYGVTKELEHRNGDKGYIIDNGLAAQEFIGENINILQQIIAKFKEEQDK